MNNPTKYLALALCSLTLVACGGGGGGDSGEPAAQIGTGTIDTLLSGSIDNFPSDSPILSATSTELTKYAGVWRQACVDHKRLSIDLQVTNNKFTVTPTETHYAYKYCTGAVVATGSYGGPSETVKYSADLNALILKDSTTILEDVRADVNPATSTIATATFTLTGSGVKPAINIGGTNYTQIQYGDVVPPVLYKERTLNGGTTYGALLLRNKGLSNEELLTLIPVTGAPDYSFKVNLQFSR